MILCVVKVIISDVMFEKLCSVFVISVRLFEMMLFVICVMVRRVFV